MGFKAEKETAKMSLRGNDAGYFLIDAIVMLLVSTLCTGIVLASAGIVIRRASDSSAGTISAIEARNADAERRTERDETRR